MTNAFPSPLPNPSSGNMPFDPFSSRAGGNYAQGEPLYPAKYRTWKASEDGTIVGFEIVIEDVRGGLAADQDIFTRAHNKAYWCTLDQRFPRGLFLNTIANNAVPTDFTSEVGIHHAQIGSSFAIGVGATVNSALFTNTSASDPTPSARTFTPTSAITGLWSVILNNIRYIAIGRLTDPVYLISDLAATPTSPGTMHANTEPCWGIIQTSLPGSPLLIYAGANIYNNLVASSAIGAAVTASDITNIAQGGYAIGELSLGGGPRRAYWYVPGVTNTAGDLAGTNYGRVQHCSLEGTDLLDLDFPMRGIWSAARFRDGIVATDSGQVFWHRGTPINLKWAESRDPAIGVGGSYPFVYGFHINGDQLSVLVAASSGANGSWWAETLDLETGRWHISRRGYTTSGLTPIRASGSNPFNQQTQVAYAGLSGAASAFFWQYVPSVGKRTQIILKDLSAVTIGSDLAASFQGYESAGTLFGPFFELPGLEGWAKSVSAILHSGDMSDDMVSATGTPLVTVRVTGVPITITTGVPQTTSADSAIVRTFGRTSNPVTQVQPIPGNTDGRGAFRVEISLTRGDDTDRTPNGLPIIIRGYAYMPDWLQKMKPPADYLSLPESY